MTIIGKNIRMLWLPFALCLAASCGDQPVAPEVPAPELAQKEALSQPSWTTGAWLLSMADENAGLDLDKGTISFPGLDLLAVPIQSELNGAKLNVTFTLPRIGSGRMSLEHSAGTLKGTAWAQGQSVAVRGMRPSSGVNAPSPVAPEATLSRIAVSPESAELEVGGTVRLTAAGYDSGNRPVSGTQVTWSSSNSDVAAVNESGVVTARRAGSATVTATAGSVRQRAEITVVAGEQAPPPSSPSQSGDYPNRPSGLSVIGAMDGSVKESGGSAFGISSFGSWSSSGARNVSVVSDRSNPTGSGSALRFRWEASQNSAGSATAGRFAGGPYRELYLMTRIYMESGGWDFGHKFFYIGAASGARNNTSSPTQYYVTRERRDNLRFINQNVGSSVIIDSSDPAPRGNGSNPFERDRWLNIEYHLVAESSPGAGDGRMSVWVNGQLVGSSNAVRWTDRSDSTVGFDGMEWYARANSVTADSYYRLGELYIAGR